MRKLTAGLVLLLLVAGAVAASCGGNGEDEAEQLRIGYLADRSGSLAELGDVISVGVELAVQHINEAGGVNGRDVVLVSGDTKVNPTQGVEEARRLVEVEGVQAIVGAISSTVTLAVTESVIGPSGVVMITPSASSPALSTSNDNDFLFRSAPSDVAKGVILAALAREEGLDNVGLLYRDDAYGQGLAEVFTQHFGGTVSAASYSALGQTSYLAELQQAASGGADLLVVVAFPGEAEVFLRESIENGDLHAVRLRRRDPQRGSGREDRPRAPRRRPGHRARQRPRRALDGGVEPCLCRAVRRAAGARLRTRGLRRRDRHRARRRGRRLNRQRRDPRPTTQRRPAAGPDRDRRARGRQGCP